MKISEYVVLIYNFQTGIANRSILVKKHWFIAKLISWPWEGAIQHKEFIIYNFITLDSISIGTTINEYCRNAYASNMLIWTKFMTPYQNFVLPLNKQNFVIPSHFSWLRCHMKGQKPNFLEMWFSLWNSDTARQTTFRFPLFKLILITHAWNMHHNELHQMKEEDLSFPNMCHLLIINVIKLW